MYTSISTLPQFQTRDTCKTSVSIKTMNGSTQLTQFHLELVYTPHRITAASYGHVVLALPITSAKPIEEE